MFQRFPFLTIRAGLTAIAMLCASLSLTGCISTSKNVPSAGPNFTAPDSERINLSEAGRIGTFDLLHVDVFELESMARDVQVDATGNITLPLAGTVAAAGKTAPELAADIRTKLLTYIRRPNVSVTIKQTVPQSVTVDGSIARPGMYPMQGRITLQQAIALGGGLNEFADPKRVVVFRTINGERNAAAFDLNAIRGGAVDDPVVYGNDVIVVDGSNLRRAYRDLIQTIPVLALFARF